MASVPLIGPVRDDRSCLTPCLCCLWRVILVSATVLCGPAEGGDFPLWEVGAGVGVLSIPDYRGSAEQRGYVLPIPYLVYRGERMQVDRDKVRGLLLSGRRWELDISANAGVPVSSDSNAARSGMPDIDPTVELGPQFSLTIAGGSNESYQLDLRLPLRQVWAVDPPHLRPVGRVFNPVINLDLRHRWPGPGWKLGIQAGPTFADRDYHRYYYEVDEAYANASRQAYVAQEGYSGAQTTASLSRRFANVWFGAFLRVTDLHGASIEDSPLVRRKTNVMAGLGVSWIFAQSTARVEANE